MIQLANFEEREFYIDLGQQITVCDLTLVYQMTEESFLVRLVADKTNDRATKFSYTATNLPEGQYLASFAKVDGTKLVTVAAFVTGDPIFATSQYNTYNDDGTSTTFVPSDDQGLVPSVSQRLRVKTEDDATDVSYVRTVNVTNGTLTDDGNGEVTLDTGGVDTLEALTDVTITSLTPSQFLQYNGISGFWENETLYFATLADTKGTPTEGQLVKYTGGFWQPADIGLNDLDGVSITSPSTGNVLQYSSTLGWYNTNLPTPSPPPSTTDALPEGSVNLYYTEARVSANTDVSANTAKVGITAQQAADILNNNAKVGLIAGGTTGQALVKSTGTDYDVEWADIAVDTQYHDRFQTDAETFRSGATDTVELYYTAKADGDGLAESASSDTPTAGYDIRRKLYYSEEAFADPDTGTWVQFTAIADNTTFANAKAALLEYLKARTGGTVPISLKQTWEEVSQTAYLLDQSYGSGAEAAYSVRRLNGNYTGAAIQVERSSDNTTQDIGFDSNGDLDESALTTFCTGTTCKVRTWYDQSQSGGTGSGNDATQSDHALQPRIYASGAIEKENGKVIVRSTTSTDRLLFETTLSDSNVDIFSAARPRSGITLNVLFGIGSNDPLFVTQSGDSSNLGALGSTARYIDGTSFSGTTRGDLYSATINKNVILTAIDCDLSTASLNSIGWDRSPSTSFNMYSTQELILFTSDKSTVRTSIEENVGDYFTQNTPLLDTYSGAAAAYSLRLLDSSYVGSAVEVYNGSSYADIGFNVFGELDTVALAAHCGSNSGYVSKWYSQTGSNDAVQTNTANMPKIYDGTTGVVTENGKPAVNYGTASNSYYLEVASYTSLSYQSISTITVGSNAQSFSTEGSISFTMLGLNTNPRYYHNIGLTGGLYFSYSALEAIQLSTTSQNSQYLSTIYANNSTASAYFNGTSKGSVTSLSGTSSRIALGYNGGTSYHNGNIQEVIIYNSDQDAAGNRTGIETNLNTFYNIYS